VPTTGAAPEPVADADPVEVVPDNCALGLEVYSGARVCRVRRVIRVPASPVGHSEKVASQLEGWHLVTFYTVAQGRTDISGVWQPRVLHLQRGPAA